MVAEVLTYSEKDRWLEALNKLPDGVASVFAHPEYMRVYSEKESLQCFVKTEGNNRFIYPFVKRNIPGHLDLSDVSSTYGYGGPLISENTTGFVREAINELREYLVAECVIAELIKLNPLIESGNETFLESYYGVSQVVREVVAVPVTHVPTYLLANEYKRENRKAIRRAEKAGVKIEFSTDRALWTKFLLLYSETMHLNRAESQYVLDQSFVDSLSTGIPDNYVLVSAHFEGSVISVLLVLFDRANAYCHLIGTTSDPKFRNLQANNLLHHEVAVWAYEKGLRRLMIGGGRTNAEDDSLLRFKASFAKRKLDFTVCEAILNHEAYDQMKMKFPENSEEQKLLFYRNTLI